MEKELFFVDAATMLAGQLAAMPAEEAIAAVHGFLYPDDETAESALPDPNYSTLDDQIIATLAALPQETAMAFFGAYAESADVRDQQDVLSFLPVLLVCEGEPHEFGLRIWRSFLADTSYDLSRLAFTHLETSIEQASDDIHNFTETTGLNTEEATALIVHYGLSHPTMAAQAKARNVPKLLKLAVQAARDSVESKAP